MGSWKCITDSGNLMPVLPCLLNYEIFLQIVTTICRQEKIRILLPSIIFLKMFPPPLPIISLCWYYLHKSSPAAHYSHHNFWKLFLTYTIKTYFVKCHFQTIKKIFIFYLFDVGECQSCKIQDVSISVYLPLQKWQNQQRTLKWDK